VDWTNAHGGVNGHPVKDIVLDDASVPAKGIADAKELISDHVAAIVGSASNTIASWYQLITKAGIPVIGGEVNGGPLYQTVPGLYPTGTTSAAPALDIAKKAGKTKLAVLYCSEVPVCASAETAIKNTLAADASEFPGVQVVYTAAISGSAPNYTSQCLAAEQAGADSIVLEEGAAVTVRVIDNCATQGYKPTLIGIGAEADNTWLKDPNFNGVQVYQPDFPWFASSTAAQQEFQSALKQYAPQELTAVTFNPNDAQVWASLEVFAAAVEKTKPATVDSATVLAAINSLPKNFSISSITPPLTFAKDAPNPNVNCYFLVAISGGKWTIPGSSAAICPGSS
jgi:branched-chain amino acid transport system substrate-binding protein